MGSQRIIPARAGFTYGGLQIRQRRPDHPRSHGVYKAPRPFSKSPRGSSPLARGLRSVKWRASHWPRIIPARAGFTRQYRAAGTENTDHPRSRGVYLLTVSAPRAGAGSSPLARGLHLRNIPFRIERGIIPARAGFTSRLRCRPWSPGDHPRSRGVYSDPSSPATRATGSSPLARGLHE